MLYTHITTHTCPLSPSQGTRGEKSVDYNVPAPRNTPNVNPKRHWHPPNTHIRTYQVVDHSPPRIPNTHSAESAKVSSMQANCKGQNQEFCTVTILSSHVFRAQLQVRRRATRPQAFFTKSPRGRLSISIRRYLAFFSRSENDIPTWIPLDDS